MFAVIIPTWEDAPCWKALVGSDFNRHHLHLPAGQHGYCEGAQHNRCAARCPARPCPGSSAAGMPTATERCPHDFREQVCAGGESLS